MRLKRTLVASASTVFLIGGLQVVGMSSADAATCTVGKTQTKWTKAKKPFKMIGIKSLTLGAHAGYVDEVTLERENTYTGSVTTSAEVSANFKVKMLASLEGKLGLELKGIKSSTKKLTMKETFSIPGSSSQQRYVLYKGVRRATGDWQWRTCQQATRAPDSRAWTPWIKGKAGSWNHDYVGLINCRVSQKEGSIEAVAKASGC